MVQDAGGTWRLEESLSGRMTEPGLFLFWFGSDLFYANVAFFAEQARRLVRDSSSPVRWLAIDATAITGLDFSAGRALAELHQDLAKANVVLALVQIPAERHAHLERMGLVDLIGSGRIFDSRHACVAAFKSECNKSAVNVSSQ